jgi:ribosomal protein S18 acetylase RimI-like enzyme
MRCDNYTIIDICNSKFKIRNYQDGDEQYWSIIECAIGDFDSECEAKKYFVQHYKLSELYERCFFAEDDNGNVVGTCIAWYDNKDDCVLSSLHWLAVLPEYQNQGIGRLLVLAVMNYYKQNDLLPVYLHTQPWSYKAIALYSSIGFNILKEDTFADYTNEYDEAIKILENYLPLSNLNIE